MLLQDLQKKELIHPPKWLPDNTQYLTIMGSQCYGTATEDSDTDIYGFSIPKLEDVFPHLTGSIQNFGRQKKHFNCWQEHGIKDGKKEYDFQVYSIVKYFSLLMENNPSVLDSLFSPINCVIHCTKIGQLVRDNRKLFLHKGLFHKYRGYSMSQLHKMETKNPQGKRKKMRDEQGWDWKFGMHVTRLLLEAQQLLQTGDLDMQKDRELLKSIRRGEWNPKRIRDWFEKKDKYLEELYEKSTLPYGPDEEKIKQLLLQCLEIQYGSLDKVIHQPNKYENALRDISKICENVNL